MVYWSTVANYLLNKIEYISPESVESQTPYNGISITVTKVLFYIRQVLEGLQR